MVTTRYFIREIDGEPVALLRLRDGAADVEFVNRTHSAWTPAPGLVTELSGSGGGPDYDEVTAKVAGSVAPKFGLMHMKTLEGEDVFVSTEDFMKSKMGQRSAKA